MTQSDFIKAINQITSEWRTEKGLFCGGCAYAAAIIAKTFESAGIEYDVVSYDYCEVNPIKTKRSCGHLGIRVKSNTGYTYIGGEFHNFLVPFEMSLGMVSSKTIMKYYRDIRKQGEWNTIYDINCNSTFSRLCNNILKMYI